MQRPKTRGEWTRREFLATSAAGAGIAVVPGFLIGCGASVKSPAQPAPDAGPAPVAVGYFADFGVDEQVVRRILARAMSRGGDFADLYFQHTLTNYIVLQDGEVNRAYSIVELGCGVRVLKGDQTGFAFTEDLSEESLASAAATAAVVADGAGSEGAGAIRRVDTSEHYAIEVPWTNVGIDSKIPLLDRANRVAMDHDERMIKVQAYMGDTTSRILIATSEGAIVEDYQPMATIGVTCVAEDGGRREENYFSWGQRRGFEALSDGAIADDVAKKAAERTTILFEAEPPPAGEYPIVLSPGLSGILLHEAMGHGFEADFNRKGTSVYSEMIGKRIAPEFVTIVDDGTNPHERGTLNVDDEGSPIQRTVLVENGVLRTYMHDRISARHYGVETTANGRRECYRFPPVPRMRNTYMIDGPHDPEEIVRSVDEGVYAETFTNGQVRIGSGDFSFYLKNGYLIEKGEITRPVKDANLIGFGPKVLENVEMVGNDMALFSGTGMCGKDGQRVPVGFGLPTVKCGAISVGGAE